MKITKLINIFEQLIPIYQKALDEEYDIDQLTENFLEEGLCCASHFLLKEKLEEAFEGYYSHFTDDFGYLYTSALNQENAPLKSIRKRLGFLKREVKDLNKMLKNYTDI